jgi:hypothetical protein
MTTKGLHNEETTPFLVKTGCERMHRQRHEHTNNENPLTFEKPWVSTAI